MRATSDSARGTPTIAANATIGPMRRRRRHTTAAYTAPPIAAYITPSGRVQHISSHNAADRGIRCSHAPRSGSEPAGAGEEASGCRTSRSRIVAATAPMSSSENRLFSRPDAHQIAYCALIARAIGAASAPDPRWPASARRRSATRHVSHSVGRPRTIARGFATVKAVEAEEVEHSEQRHPGRIADGLDPLAAGPGDDALAHGNVARVRVADRRVVDGPAPAGGLMEHHRHRSDGDHRAFGADRHGRCPIPFRRI